MTNMKGLPYLHVILPSFLGTVHYTLKFFTEISVIMYITYKMFRESVDDSNSWLIVSYAILQRTILFSGIKNAYVTNVHNHPHL